jgi:hypothetical protein
MNHIFEHVAGRVASAAGRPRAFVLALGVIVVWAVTGPLFHWSDTWQLVINTGTTIITFLMVFLIQNAQNRDAAACGDCNSGDAGESQFAVLLYDPGLSPRRAAQRRKGHGGVHRRCQS